MERNSLIFIFLCFFAQVFAQQDKTWTSLLASGTPGNPTIRQYHSTTQISQSTKALLFSGVTYDGSRTFNLEDTWILDLAANNSWVQVHSHGGAPRGRGYHSAVANADEVIIYGGRTENVDLLSDVWRFKASFQSWVQDTFTGNVSAPVRTFHSAVLDDIRMLVFGGYAGDLWTTSNDLWSYDTIENSWKLLIPNGAAGSPPPRQGHVAVYAFDKTLGPGFIIFGGYTDKGGYNDAWRYYSNSNKWAQITVSGEILPEGRFGLSAASADYVNVDGTELIIFGGEFVGSADETYHNDVWSLKVTGNVGTWTRLVQDNGTQGPWKRAGHASFKYGKNFYSFAGYGQYVGLYNDLWKLDYEF